MKVQNYLIKRHGKHILFTLLFITIALILVNGSFAAITKDILIVDKLQSDRSMTESITISLSNNLDPIFSIVLPDSAHNIIANDINISNNTINLTLNCTECNIRISYDLNNIVKTELSYQIFYRTLHFPSSPQSLRYIVYLPSGYTVNNSDSTPAIVPNPTAILTDGSRVMIEWTENNPQLPKQYYIKFIGIEQSETAQEFLQEDIYNPDIVFILIIILVLGLIIGFFIKFVIEQKISKAKTKPEKKIAVNHVIPSSLLSPDEKIVMNLLKQKDAKLHPMNQKDIGKELNWSKSKVSAVLSNLYYKKLIDREKFGRNYKVKLLKEISE